MSDFNNRGEGETSLATICAAIDKDAAEAWEKYTGDAPQSLEAIPPHLRGGLVRYVLLGIKTGSFLQAVIENDFCSASIRADDISGRFSRELARFIYNEMPTGAWGSNAKMKEWIAEGGLLGKRDTIK